ncbi:hypothetical protein [Yoonia sp. BS5-3]|uniref:TetR/AcrR family transcriptional regulator n=1 Tax=Yoonia phaeophyticola TaxID=3137369 RepID=A0ABZ2V2B2_9RHOB
MPEVKRRGRPKKQSGGVDKAAVLRCAQSVLETHGLEKLTFRALAAKLGVTAMAAKYHVGSRDQLLSDLAAQIFEGIDAGDAGETPSAELRQLLVRYSELALKNADLVRFLLSNPNCMPKALGEFTTQVRRRTQAINHGDAGDVMLNLLIDYVHGFVFAADAAPTGVNLTLDNCMSSIDWLMDVMESRR